MRFTPPRRFRPRLAALLLLLAALPFVGALAADARPLVAGTDYAVIEGGQPWQPLAGKKAEVVEIFAYWCQHCAHFEPAVDAWRRKLPKDVRFSYLPAAFDPADAFARAFFAARGAGVLERNHAALFRAIHDERTLPPNATADELAAWFGTRGASAAKLKAAMSGPAVAAEMKRAREFAVRSDIEGTPTLVVNGRYRVLGSSRDDVLRNAAALVAQLRAGKTP